MIPSGTLEWLRSPELRPLWEAVHARLVRNARDVTGKVRLDGLTEEQRIAVALLLERAAEARPTVQLAALDGRLRESSAGTGLLNVVEAVVGPVPDRKTDASIEAARRSLLHDHGQAALVASGLHEYPWAADWLDRLWRGGLAARQSTESTRLLVTQAAGALGLTVGAHARLWSRGELAHAVTGSAHGLDDDAALTRLVLRGLALAINGTPEPPAGAAQRRALWESAGVSQDTVATTVLTYGLRPLDETWRASHLRERAAGHAETHLTLREVRRLTPMRLAPQVVYVCENPRVLEAAAEAGVADALVCTMGNPTTVTLALLDTVTASPGVRLAYHGDFDWPGLAIAERLMRRYQATPWRFGATDYLEAVARCRDGGMPLQPLSGRAVPSVWDSALATAMSGEAVTVHEEAVVDRLLADLSV